MLIPGLQGRWEYMRPTVDALSASFRVLTFSLDDVPADPRVRAGLDGYADHIAALLTTKRIEHATICGVSFGGVVAVRVAATQPARTSGLILVSTPGPTWHLEPRHRLYASAPWVFGPLFAAETPWRLGPELAAALPRPGARARFGLAQLRTLLHAPVSFGRMADRARIISTLDLTDECARITAPTLIVTGERDLDHVVPVDGSCEYLRLIPDSRAVVLERTGHLGSITRPDAFADVVRAFTERQRHAAA